MTLVDKVAAHACQMLDHWDAYLIFAFLMAGGAFVAYGVFGIFTRAF